METIRIGNKWIGGGYPCFVVAEIGINHNGSLETAKKMIDAAIDAGADAVKFQKRTVDVIYTKEELAKSRENPFGPTNGDLKRGLEFGLKEYLEIDNYCRGKNIMWFASCWDEASVDFIAQFDPPCYKIGSASLTDKNLLRYTRSKGKPILLSTGMSTLEQIRRAVEILGHSDLILLHCVSTYPTPDSELNLQVIKTLQKEFPDIPIGYSGHGYGTTMGVCAAALGACVIERHITLDVSMWGSDQPASLEFWKFKQMVVNIRRFEKALGSGVKRVLPSEIPVMGKLRRKTDF
ncbi:MAG: N-acetylneuraminate synthase family protein [Candidatus Azambacteria bacterium]|nr:N-acetylneuraminate synthase family protein [Candidatus Azambacteria bacterium]